MEYFDNIEWINEKYGQRYCNSGGAAGADTIFEDGCTKKGIPVIAWSFEGHNTKSPNRKVLSKEELKEGWGHIEIANKSLKRNIYNLSPYVKNLLARNWFQVKYSDAIYAVGEMTDDFKFVQGGTGWAVQMAIDNNKDVFFFDQEKNKISQNNPKPIEFWYFYNYETKTFAMYPYDKSGIKIPPLKDRFAGIGTREINEFGIKAIKNLLNQ